MYPATIRASFDECEHIGGDLRHYIDELAAAGAKILSSEVDLNSEVGLIKFSVADAAVAARITVTSAWDDFGPGFDLVAFIEEKGTAQ